MPTLTIRLKNAKVKKLIKSLEENNLIEVLYEDNPRWSREKNRRAKEFLNSYREAKLAVAGKIKLKTLDEVLNDL
jgi:hypothetical protein